MPSRLWSRKCMLWLGRGYCQEKFLGMIYYKKSPAMNCSPILNPHNLRLLGKRRLPRFWLASSISPSVPTSSIGSTFLRLVSMGKVSVFKPSPMRKVISQRWVSLGGWMNGRAPCLPTWNNSSVSSRCHRRRPRAWLPSWNRRTNNNNKPWKKKEKKEKEGNKWRWFSRMRSRSNHRRRLLRGKWRERWMEFRRRSFPNNNPKTLQDHSGRQLKRNDD